MAVNSDFRELLKIFNAARIRYLIVGGYAVIEYIEPRYTKDLNIWISPDPTNAKIRITPDGKSYAYSYTHSLMTCVKDRATLPLPAVLLRIHKLPNPFGFPPPE